MQRTYRAVKARRRQPLLMAIESRAEAGRENLTHAADVSAQSKRKNWCRTADPSSVNGTGGKDGTEEISDNFATSCFSRTPSC